MTTAATRPLVVTPDNRATALHVVGELITVLAPAHATSGHEIFLQVGTENSGPPPHSHAWDESFFVIEGRVEFGYDDRKMVAGSGTLVHIPAGTVHWFRTCAGGARMLSVTGPGSHAAAMFGDISTEIPQGPPDVEKLVTVAARHGVAFHLN
jgi:quercetin dioxygenase-like cupin family protein